MNVRFDGVYQYNDSYLRFYENGNVYSGSIKQSPEEAAEWLQKASYGDGYVKRGDYKISTNKINFNVKDKNGSIDYKGSILSDRLELNIHSHINDFKGSAVYTFIEIENLVDRSNEPLPDRTGKILNYNGDWEEQFLYFEKLDENEAIKKYSFDKYNEVIIMYDKSDSKIIPTLDKNWPKLEAKLIEKLEEMVKSSERVGHLKVKHFQANAGSYETDGNNFLDKEYPDKKPNFSITFYLLESPVWDFYIQDDEIVHYQPVY